jgi:hypothetical protein
MKKQDIGKSHRNLRLYKQTLGKLTSNELEVAIGLLLGDASLQTQDRGKTFRLKLGQSDKHYDYLVHLCDTIFSRWILSPPKK